MNFTFRYKPLVCTLLILQCLFACSEDDQVENPNQPDDKIFKIPVVVHVLHHGEPLGEGYNLSDQRIIDQMASLNNDFRRKAGTSGFNDHPNGADTGIEFVLAKQSEDGSPTDGIVRVNIDEIENPVSPSYRFDHYAYYSYWNYKKYLNIWIEPLPESSIDVVLGQATGPDVDLPGHHLFGKGEPVQSEGILINTFHFGNADIPSQHNLGRTLTHEVGHYLGLLHLWGDGDCQTNDYCDDTPPVTQHHYGCPSSPPLACDGQEAMYQNYMDYTDDACMNIFTGDQVERMQYVLEHSVNRKSLLTSPGLTAPL